MNEHMAQAVESTLLESMRELMGQVWDAGGRRLALPPVRVVVGRICDSEPLLQTEIALGRSMPHRLVQGIGALAMLCRVDRGILAVDRSAKDVLQGIESEAQGTRVEVVALPPRCPMDADSLICDLEQIGGQRLGRDALVVDAVVLADVARVMEGQLPGRRTVTVCGHLRRPAVLQAPLGTSMTDLVAACDGSPDPGWIPFHNGVLTGQPVGWDHSVDLDTRGVVVLPHDHPQVRRSSTPLSDRLARIPSACVNCRICTDVCPVNLNGGRLKTHRLMQAIATGWPESDIDPRGPVLGALECTECGICSPLCPSGLRPSEAAIAVARWLRQQGCSLVDHHAIRPHPDRMGRRLSVARLAEMLGLGSYASDRSLRVGTLLPHRITIPPRSPCGGSRVITVSSGQSVALGEVVALAAAGSDDVDLRSPVSGRVVMVDRDQGLEIAAT